jgi:hypothetical protein
MTSLIYDYETLSDDMINGVVVNLAAILFEEKRFIENPYEYDELIDSAYFVKFDVMEQVEKYGRTIRKKTLDWWAEQSLEARLMLKPSADDVSIDTIADFFCNTLQSQLCSKVYTRGNTFDPILTETLHRNIGKNDSTKWWLIRDVRSLFEGMTYGHKIKNNFIPAGLEDKFIAHNPIHDIAMDVMRFQYLARVLINE